VGGVPTFPPPFGGGGGKKDFATALTIEEFCKREL